MRRKQNAAGSLMMGLFSNFDISKAQVSGGGQYLEPGEYVLKVEATKGIDARKQGPTLVVDFVVVESNNDKTRVGDRRNYLVSLKTDWGPGNAKEVLCALSGLDALSGADAEKVNAENWTKVLETCVTTPIFKDHLVRARATRKLKRNADPSKEDSFYTRVFFAPHDATREKLHGKPTSTKK